MKNLFLFILVLAIASLSLNAVQSEAGSKEVAKINDAIDVVNSLVDIPEKEIPPALLKNSYGIALIPGVFKAGFIVGARFGSGIVLVRDEKTGEWSNPAFIQIGGGSVGWQIGAESIDIIFVFKSRKSIENMMNGKFTLGADAGVAAGPVGRQAGAATDILLKSEIYSYSRSRGLFAGLSVEGAVLQIDDDANKAFYGEDVARSADIFADKEIKAPPVVKKLKDALSAAVAGGLITPNEKKGDLNAE